MADSSVSSTVPVTVLTGFLGAGKTTLLNHILTADHGKRYAVVVNEFGELGIDNDLVVDADEEVFEMNNGCICCTVRGDLIRILGRLLRKAGRFDGIIIETTGLADPAPVAQTFFVDETIRRKARLDAIITVVDACHYTQTLKESPEAINQIAFADVLLLNKCDLIDEKTRRTLIAQLRQTNRVAEIHTTERGGVALAHILERGGFDLKRALQTMPDFLGPDLLEPESPNGDSAHDHSHHTDHNHDDHDHGGHHHDHAHEAGIGSVSLRLETPLDEERFHAWIGAVLQEQGPDILRSKGILHFEGQEERFAFQAVHMMAEGAYIGPYKKGESRESRLVFIGRNLKENQLRQGFERCAILPQG